MWASRFHPDGLIHQISRAVVIATFSIFFVYIFYGGAVISQQASKQCERLFDRCYWIFIASILSWLVDNVFCDVLQHELIPYINFHAVWHLGSCLGIYYLLQTMMVFNLEEYQEKQVRVMTFA